MSSEEYIAKKVSECYWQEDINCATTMLRILAELHEIPLEHQVVSAAIGMHGAGGFAAQCGLVEGSLMFIGILGTEKGLAAEEIVDWCYCFAQEFKDQFGSLSCSQLRPEGFKADNPPHLCEGLTTRAVIFTTMYLARRFKTAIA